MAENNDILGISAHADFSDMYRELSTLMEKFRESVSSVNKLKEELQHLAQSGANAETLIKKVQQLADAQTKASQEALSALDANRKYWTSLNASGKDITGAQKANEELNRSYKELTEGAKESKAIVDKYSDAIANSSKETEKAGEEIGDAAKETASKIKTESNGVSNILENLKKSVLSLVGAWTAKELINNVIQVRGQFQQLEVAFSTMLGSEEKATDLMNQLVKTAATTPFDLQSVAAGAKSLMAYGTAAEDVNKTLVRLGDIAAGMSIPLNDLVYLYGTTMVQGRMFTQDLRQFQGRGIPIAEELAKVLQTTKDKIPELVTAGKVTSEVFEKAIVSMTEAGSKFGGLMEKQSKTIVGQISNIEDSIDIMFNEIGQNSEGIINGALGVVSTLVENYKTLGKILLDCAVVYGTYKTSLMAVTAMQALQTAGTTTLTVAEAAHYGWLVLIEKAQKLLNATLLSNPYVLVATALSTMVASMVLFNDEAKDTGEIIEEANKKIQSSYEETEAQIKTEKKSIDELFDKLRKAKEGTDEYKETKDKILNQYGPYLKGLSNEISTLKDVEGAYKAVAKAARDASLARGKEAALSKANADYTQSHSDTMTKIYDKVKERGGENNAQLALDVIRKDLEKSGEVAEDTQRLLHDKYGVKYTYFGELNRAEQTLVTEIQKVNALFGEQKKEAEAVTKTLSEEYAEAEKNYNEAKKRVSEIEKNKSKYTANDYKDATEKLKAKKKAFEEVGGEPDKKKPKSTAKEEKEADKRSANEIREELKHQEELAKIRQRALDAAEDARIANIQSNGERERAKQDEQHKRNLRQIEQQADEMRKAIYEHNKREYENSHKNSPYELTPQGKAGWKDIQLSENEQKIINSLIAKENTEYERLLQERQSNELQSLRNYLKEYGTFQQQKLAIAEEYADKIRKAETKGEAMRLRREREVAFGSAKAKELARGIDFSQMFDGVGTIVREIAKQTYSEVQQYKQTDEYKNSNAETKQAISNLEAKLIEKGGAGYASPFNIKTWDDITKAAKKYEEALKDVQEKTDAHTEAVKGLEAAENLLKTSTNNTQKLFATAAVSNAKEKVKTTGKAQQKAEEKLAGAQHEVTDATTRAAKGLQDFNSALSQITSGSLSGFANGISSLIGQLSGKGKQDITGLLGPKIGGIIGAIIGIIDTLGDNPGQYMGDLVDKVFALLNGFLNQLFNGELIGKLVEAIVKGVSQLIGNIVGQIGQGGGFGMVFNTIQGVVNGFTDGISKGLGITKDTRGEVDARIKESNDILQSIDKSVNRIADKLGDSYGATAITSYNDLLKQYESKGTQYNTQIQNAGGGYYGRGHTEWYYRNQNGGEGENGFVSRIRKFLGLEQGDYDTSWQGLFSQLESMGTEGAKKLAELRKAAEEGNEEAIALWFQINNTGWDDEGRISKAANAWADLADSMEDAQRKLYERLTTTTKENVFDDYLNSLYALANGSEDVFDEIAKNWQEMVNKMVINNIIGSKQQKALEDWYENLAQVYEEGISEEEYAKRLKDAKDEYDRIVQEGADEVNRLREMGVIKETDNTKQQSATSNSAQNISYEQADSLVGIETAKLIAVEQILREQNIQSQEIKDIASVVPAIGASISNIKENIQEVVETQHSMNNHLANISRYTSVLPTMAEDIANIKKHVNEQ